MSARRGLIVTFTLAALAMPAQASAVAPVNGARYDEFPATNFRNFVEVNRTGTRLASYDVGTFMTCSDGRRRSLGLVSRGEKPTTIAPDGSFSYTSPDRSFTVGEKVRAPVKGKAQTGFSGTFPTADSATVTITSRFRSKRLNCDGSQQVTLGRDGTPGAPLQGPRLGTGRYRASGRGVRVTRLTALGPAGVLDPFRITARISCRNGSYYRSTYGFDGFLLRANDRGSTRGGARFRVKGGYRVRERYRMSIGFSRVGATYRVGGSITFRARVTRGGQTTTCFSRRPFSGRLVSGPA